MFPKIKKYREGNTEKVKVSFLKNSVGLAIDEDLCQGCGICIKICPRQALDRGPVGGSKLKTDPNIVPTGVDPKLCSFCGLCSYLCPWGAIHLLNDDKIVELNNLQIVKEHAVPELVYKIVKCKPGVPDAKSYLEGDIEFATSNCPGGCSTCINVCPTGALKLEKSDAPWEKGRKIVVDKDKCILCGTCTNACPVYNAIKIKITNIKTKGPYNALLWDRVVSQIKISRMREGKKIN
jgi:4Fe-4S ferredoxin